MIEDRFQQKFVTVNCNYVYCKTDIKLTPLSVLFEQRFINTQHIYYQHK